MTYQLLHRASSEAGKCVFLSQNVLIIELHDAVFKLVEATLSNTMRRMCFNAGKGIRNPEEQTEEVAFCGDKILSEIFTRGTIKKEEHLKSQVVFMDEMWSKAPEKTC